MEDHHEAEVRKTTVYREGSSGSPKAILPVVIAVLVVVAVLVYFILSRT